VKSQHRVRSAPKIAVRILKKSHGNKRSTAQTDSKRNFYINICQEDTAMKQSKLLVELYRACVDHDAKKIAKLQQKEFRKIAKHKAEGKPFTHKWALVQI